MEIKLCGVGGQGMGFAGRILGEAAIISGLHVAQTTAYGVESRGGLSTADVIICPEQIHFPEVRRPDALLIMADKGIESNLRGAHDKTLILHDPGTVSQAIEGPGNKKSIPFLSISLKEFGSGNAATMIGIGTLIEYTGVISLDNMMEAIRTCLPVRAHQENLDALLIGKNLS